MRRTVKRESAATGVSGGSREADEDEPERLRSVKNEKLRKNGADSERPEEPPTQEEEQGISDRRILRSQYLALINKISGNIHSRTLLTLLYVTIDWFRLFRFNLDFSFFLLVISLFCRF